MLTFEPGHIVLYTRLTMVSAKKSIIPEFQQMIETMGYEDHFHITQDQIINKHSGSKIWFIGLKGSSGYNTARLKSIPGVTTWIIDEFEDMMDEEKLFDTIDNSIRTTGKQNRVFLLMNPQTREFWAYDRWFDKQQIQPKEEEWTTSKNDTTYIHTTWETNAENLSESWIKKAHFVKKTNPEKYRHEYMGGWLDRAEGVVFTNWDWLDDKYVWEEGRIYDKTDQRQRTRTLWEGEIVFGQDYGWSPDVTTLIKCGVNAYRKEIYLHECFYKNGMETAEITRENLKYAGPDNLIVGDSADPRIINEISKYCNIVPAQKGPDSLTAGIQVLQDYKLLITRESENLAKELRNYVWDDNKRDKPVDRYNHAIDAIRYAVADAILDSYENDLFYG